VYQFICSAGKKNESNLIFPKVAQVLHCVFFRRGPGLTVLFMTVESGKTWVFHFVMKLYFSIKNAVLFKMSYKKRDSQTLRICRNRVQIFLEI
jgi:hypothetical protein